MRFAHLKPILKLGRLRLRGRRGDHDAFVLAAIAQNLWRLAALIAWLAPTHDSVQRKVRDVSRASSLADQSRLPFLPDGHPLGAPDFWNRIR
jgi:hypothetical protein